MLTALSKTFDRFLATRFPKFDPIDNPGDWHLRLLWIPDGKQFKLWFWDGLGEYTVEAR